MNDRAIYTSSWKNEREREREKPRRYISSYNRAHPAERERRRTTSLPYTLLSVASVARRCDHVLAIGKREQNSWCGPDGSTVNL